MTAETQDFIDHPKTQLDGFKDAAEILRAGDSYKRTPEERNAALKEIKSKLEAMTPIEREMIAQSLTPMQRGDEHENTTTPEKGSWSAPAISLEFDGKDIKAINFRSVSDDEHFGEQVKLTLDQRRLTEEAGSKTINQADGSPMVVKYDGDAVVDVKTAGGTKIARQPDGTYQTDEGITVTNVKVGDNGALNYSRDIENGVKAQVTERVTPNGDALTQADMDDHGKHNQWARREHVEYPKDLQRFTEVTTSIDGQQSVETTKMLWDGTRVSDTEFARVTRHLNNVVIEPMESGKLTGGSLAYKPSFGDKGETTGGKLKVTFPDGLVRDYPVEADEMQNVQGTNSLKVRWDTVNGDPHHFQLLYRK